MGIVILIGTVLENNWIKQKLLIKTIKRIQYERHGKRNKNDNSYKIRNLNKIYYQIYKHKYAANPKY